ncbi:MAG: YbaY family lipoprotein [Chloroflexota bacterium]|nr:YbaY family lipoprotein [Chloroflexota bacterium]
MAKRTAAARGSAAAFIVVALLLGIGVLPVAGANGHITGTLTYREKVALSGEAVAIVSIVDITAGPNAGMIVGQQRTDGIGEVPIPFSVPFDIRRIDPRHAYGLFAAIIDGPRSWQNPHGIAVLTGGPTSDIDAVLPLAGEPPATIVGSVTGTNPASLGLGVVAVASLIKKETGTVVSRQVLVAPGPAPIRFSVGFDPSVIDPHATYLVKAALVDGGRIWENRTGVVSIAAGLAQPVVAVPLPAAAGSLAVDSPIGGPASPSTSSSGGAPSVSAAPAPSGSPPGGSAGPSSPSVSPSASATPSRAPSATSEPTPTTLPTATATAPSDHSPTADASAGSMPPGSGLLTGSLTYAEPHHLSTAAVAAVALVRGTARPNENPIVATQIIRSPTATPVAFSLVYDTALVDPGAQYSIQAAIVDGANAWVTGPGTAVIAGGSAGPVDLVLAYRPDLVKGEVSGSLTGVTLAPTEAAYAVAVLVDPASGQSLGIDLLATVGTVPISFSVPFALAAIDPARDYLVGARLVDGDRTWQNEAGVPVITRGNPIADVQVVVAETRAVGPGPSPGPRPSPATAGTGGDVRPGIVLLVLAFVVGVAGVVLYDRSRSDGGGSVPPAEPSA